MSICPICPICPICHLLNHSTDFDKILCWVFSLKLPAKRNVILVGLAQPRNVKRSEGKADVHFFPQICCSCKTLYVKEV